MNNVVNLKESMPASHHRKLNKLCDWIEANIDQPIGWTELAQHSGLDHLELMRQFNTHLKTSPMQWIRNKRIESKASFMAEIVAMRTQLPACLVAVPLEQVAKTKPGG